MAKKYIGRKITRAKWCKGKLFSESEIPADAVTGDLRTTSNGISFWLCGTCDALLLDDLALAIASAGDRVDRMDFIWVQQRELEDKNIRLVETQGVTPVEDLAEKHVDAVSLDYVRLGQIAGSIDSALQSERYRRFSRKQIAEVLTDAVQVGRVQLHQLKERVREEVTKQLSAVRTNQQ